jgi:hypothetical protein
MNMLPNIKALEHDINDGLLILSKKENNRDYICDFNTTISCTFVGQRLVTGTGFSVVALYTMRQGPF